MRSRFLENLNHEKDMLVAFEATSGEGALRELSQAPYDVLLIDMSLHGQSGVDVLRAVRQRDDALSVLVLTGYPEERYALAMIKNGASGYLCKDCEASELLKAIRTVASGRRYLSEVGTQLLTSQLLGE